MRVSDVLAQKGDAVYLLRPQASLQDVYDQLSLYNVGALLVSRSGSRDFSHVEGLISERDLVHAVASAGATVLSREVSEFMSTNVVSCSPQDQLQSLAGAMTELRIRHLPVVDNGLVVGLISIGDVVKHRLGELDQEHEALYSYLYAGL